MPGKEPLSNIANIPAIEAEISRVLTLIKYVSEAIETVPQIGNAYKNSSGNNDLKKKTEELITANERLLAAQKQLDNEREKSITIESNVAKQLAIQQAINKQKTADMRTEAREAAGLNDAYKKLELQYNAAQRAAKNMAATPGTPKADLDAANAKALSLSTQLKAIDAAVGQHQRNVGNYSGALKVLENSLGEANARMDQLVQSGQAGTAAGQQLGQEINLLGQLVSQQSKGFTSLSREIMATGKALETMAEQGMQSSEAFKALEAQFIESKRELNEFRKNQALLTSEAPKLQALTTAARGLAGMYALGAGSAALFADGNEKVEKELNKLVAVMTLLQGLHEVHELIEKRTAIATIATGVAQGFKNFVMTGSIKVTQAATTAQVENIAAQEGAVVATEANIVATETQTAATEATTAATTAASGAMMGLRIALLATGIGALLLLLPMIVSAMDKFTKGTKASRDALKELAEVTKQYNDVIIEQLELANKSDQSTKEYYERELAYASASGKTQYEILALKKKIAEEEKAEAKQSITALEAYNKNQADRLADIQKFTLKKAQALVEYQKALKLFDETGQEDDRGKNAAKELLDLYTKQADEQKSLYEAGEKARKDSYAATQKLGELELEEQRLSAQEQRELALVTARIVAEAHISSNERILGDERSTQAQQLLAMRSNLKQHLAIIEAEKNAKLGDPSLTPAKQKQIIDESNAAAAQANQEYQENRRKKNVEYANRDKAADQEILKAATESLAKAAEEQANNDKLSLDKRLAAFGEYNAKQRDLINQDANFKRQKAGQTSEELFAIEVERQAKLTELANAGQVKQSQIILSGLEKQSKDLQGNAQLDGIKGEVKALEELNQKFKEGKITVDAYKKEKDKISNKASRDAIELEITALGYIQGEYKKAGLDHQDIDKQIYENKKHLIELELSDEEKKAARKQQIQAKELELAKQFEATAADFIKGTYEREINAIQKQIDQNNKLKETESTRISNSTLSEQDKAAQLAILNQRTVNDNEILARKQRDAKVREAKFDRDKALFDIAANTAVAIIKAVSASPLTGGLPFSAIAAAMGALQIASVLAKPIPQYSKGTEGSAAGWALTDEKGPEGYITPSGQTYIGNDRPTLRYLEGGTKIIPHDELNRMMYNQMIQQTAGLFTFQNNNQKLENEVRGLRGDIQEQTTSLIIANARIMSKQKPPVIIIKNKDPKSDYIP